MKTVAQLEQEITIANKAYQVGRPIITDLEYDLLWKTLRELSPNSPCLYPRQLQQSIGTVITHVRPCLSLAKIMKPEEFKPFLMRFKGQVVVMEPKFDGVMVRLYGGEQPRLVLSGDGQSGKDITHLFQNVLPTNTSAMADYEAVILNQDWSPSLGANPRNVVAGLLNRDRLTDVERQLVTFIPHDTHPYQEEHVVNFFDESLWEQRCFNFYTKHRKMFPLDGVVLKVKSQDIRMVAGHNNVYPHWAIAWKPPIQIATTTVRNIRWQVTRNQRLVPVVEFDPVELCGTINKRATANNASWLFNMGCGPTAVVEIGKAGEIIPQVLAVKKTAPFKLPLTCPECGAPARINEPHLMCTGSDCMTALTMRLNHFYSRSGLFVRGISVNFFDTIMEDPIIRLEFKARPWYLFLLTPMDPLFSLMAEICTTEKLASLCGNIIETKNSNLYTQADFIGALGLKGVGLRTAKMWLLSLGNKAMKRGAVGVQAHQTLNENISLILQGLKDLPWLKHVEQETNKTFALTGTFAYPRNEIILYMESLGWSYDDPVRKSTSVLFASRDSFGSSGKWAAASRWGIQILGEKELMETISSFVKAKQFNDFIPGS